MFDTNRTSKREIKELKAKETLKKNSGTNADKKSSRKNSAAKINQTTVEEKFLLHDIFTGAQVNSCKKKAQNIVNGS